MEDVKKCNKCGEVKPIEEFKYSSKVNGTRTNLCKKCDNERRVALQKKRRKENKEVKFMLTMDQYKALEDKSKELNTTPNKYIKRVILEDKGPIVITKEGENSAAIKELLSNIYYELKRWGVNVNQMAKNSNIESKGFSFFKKKDDQSEKIDKVLNVLEKLTIDNEKAMEYMTR